MWAAVDDQVLARFRARVAAHAAELEGAVGDGRITPTRAAMELLADPSTDQPH